MHKIIFYSRKSEKNLGFTSKCRYGLVTLNTDIFNLALVYKNDQHINVYDSRGHREIILFMFDTNLYQSKGGKWFFLETYSILS